MRRHHSSKLLFLLVGILAVASSIFSIESGTMRITVTDNEKNPLPGVEVTISSPDVMKLKPLLTNAKGEVLFIGLFPALYQIKTTLQGFHDAALDNVRVSLSKETAVRIEMTITTLEKSVTVTAVAPVVDTKSATVANYVSQQFVEALPVARDFVGYLQLVSGVESVPNSGGSDTRQDPAGKGGLSYNQSGQFGSRDNVYYLEGTDITDLNTLRSGTRFNNEVIQEQAVMTSGVPAEYGGGKGVVANIITKSGGNRFSGSLNYYLQKPNFFWGFKDLAAADTRLQTYRDDKYDTAATLGGPILRDKLWFFVSGQHYDDNSKFSLSTTASPTNEEVEYSEKRNNIFGKVSFNLSGRDSINLLYFLDKYDLAGDRSKTAVKSRQFIRDRDYSSYSVSYQRLFSSNFIVDFRYGHYQMYEYTAPRYPETGPFDELQYVQGTIIPNYEKNFGQYMSMQDDLNRRDVFTLTTQWFTGSLRLKMGAIYEWDRDKDDRYIAGQEQRYSLAPRYQDWTFDQVLNANLFSLNDLRYYLLPKLNGTWSATSDALDLNKDHLITEAELRQAKFGTPNDHGVNFWRWWQDFRGENKVVAKRWIGYVVGDWNISRYFTLNAGVRLENHNYIDSTGGTILHMKTVFLPRLSFIWDIGGRGRQKLTLFYGEYAAPLGFEIIHFVGDLSGRIYAKQLFLANNWYSFYYDGSKETRNAYFAPNLKDNFAQEMSLTHAIDLGSGYLVTSQAYYRREVNIIDDYDISVYCNKLVGDPNWGQLALTYADFGYPSGPPVGTNNIVANVYGGKRVVYGFDFELAKRTLGNSSVVIQYSYKDARGNSVSNNDRGSQGNTPELDPRNPWMYGRQQGTIPHRVRVFGNYQLRFGLNVGVMLNWNAGTIYTEGYAYNRNWPLNSQWTDCVKTGLQQGPSWYQADLKFAYRFAIKNNMRAEVFLDVYNLTNNQQGINVEWTRMSTQYAYQQVNRVLNPRRLYLGARFRF